MSYKIVDQYGNRRWYKNKDSVILHREDGPAVEYNNGTSIWCINGKIHREDGPAVERSDGSRIWYLNGKYIECSSNEEFIKLLKLKAFW